MRNLFLLLFSTFHADDLKDFIEKVANYEDYRSSYLSPLKAKQYLPNLANLETEDVEEKLKLIEPANDLADEWKCALAQGWKERIEKWYVFLESGFSDYHSNLLKTGLLDKEKCLTALDHFERDLGGDDFVDGKLNPAKIMCSSWGYKGGNLYQIGNFLAKYSGKQLFPFYTGKPTQCYFAEKRDKSGEVLYSGAYGWQIEYGGVETLRNIVGYGVKDFRACGAECDAKGQLYNFTETDEEYANCRAANCGLYGQTGRLGLCYPAQCSPVELLLARDKIKDDQLFSMFMTILGNYHNDFLMMNHTSPDDAWVQRSAEVGWVEIPSGVKRLVKFVEPLYRVAKPTIIASSVLLGLYFLFVFVVGSLQPSSNAILKAFHVPTNYASLVNTKRPKKAILCLDGIRSMSIWWVVIGHMISQGIAVLENQEEIQLHLTKGDWMKSIVNALPSVDSFFCMGGILVAYLGTDKIISSSRRPVGFLMTFLLNFANRWMRIVPLLALGIWFATSIFPLLGARGISQQSLNIYGAGCVNNNVWLRSLFFVQGFYEEGASCLPHIWYLGAEFWYNLLFPFQAVLYGFHKALGVTLTVLLSCASIGWAWSRSVDQDAMPYQQQKLPYDWPKGLDEDFYLTPWSRYHAYGVGVLFGWLILAERKGNGFKSFVNKRKIIGYSIVALLWASSLFLLFFTVYGFSDICFQVDMDKYHELRVDLYYDHHQKWDVVSGCFSSPGSVHFWNATHRAIWAFALGLLIFLCDCGFGSFINSFLAFEGWNILAKLSFGVYIFHYNVIVLYQASVMEYFYVDEYWVTWMFLHITALTTAISAFTYVTYEVPLAKLWGLVVSKIQPRKKEINEENFEKIK